MITEKLLDQSTPNLITLKLQLHFAKHYSNRSNLIVTYMKIYHIDKNYTNDN